MTPMKLHSILLTALLSGFALAHAQDAAAPTPSSDSVILAPLQTQDLLLAPIPPAPSPVAPAAAEVEVPPTTAAAAPVTFKVGGAEKLRETVRIRELKTIAEEEPEVLAQKATARCAKTEEGRRVAMRNYYALLYKNIEKLDPSLEPVLEGQLHLLLFKYEQHQVCPSVLIEPIAAVPGSNSADHGTEAEKATPTPKPSKKKANKWNRFG